MDEKIINSGLDMIYLASCALHGKIPDSENVEKMDLGLVYRLAKYHSMDAITYMALAEYHKTHNGKNKEILSVWKESEADSVRKTLYFEWEREKLLRFLEQQHIWHMPLKGVVLQNLYPVIGMRQMADNDILFDRSYRSEVRDYMKENGYKVESYESDSHDVYMKPPCLNFEMHVYLYKMESAFHAYYKNVKERLVPDTGKKFGYHFSDEDFYIYCTTHAYRHFYNSGNGIRSLMDVYVYLSQKRQVLDMEYIYAELDKLGVRKYETLAVMLSEKLFSDACHDAVALKNILTEDEYNVLTFYIQSGTFGNLDNYVNSHLTGVADGTGKGKDSTKSGYVFRRLFPAMPYYKEKGRFYWLLIPFIWLRRIVKAIIKKPKSLFLEIVTLLRTKKKKR